MPSEPIPGGPNAVWAGPEDARVFFESVGMGHLAGPASLLDWRVVDIPTLCGGEPPEGEPFDVIDIVQGMVPGQAGAVRDKLHAWVDRGLWAQHCQYTDATPPPVIVPDPPPAGLPEGDNQPDPSALLRKVHDWMHWMVRSIVPRKYFIGDGFTCNDTGTVNFPSDASGEWTVWPAGVIIDVLSKPDYTGRTGGGDPAVHYDLGWFSTGGPDHFDEPVRLRRDHQMYYGRLGALRSFAFNLHPNVEIYVAPLYPETAVPLE